MVNLLTIIGVGFVLGIRHATDPDHVIAVTTIVSRQQSIRHAGRQRIDWWVVDLDNGDTLLVRGTDWLAHGSSEDSTGLVGTGHGRVGQVGRGRQERPVRQVRPVGGRR